MARSAGPLGQRVTYSLRRPVTVPCAAGRRPPVPGIAQPGNSEREPPAQRPAAHRDARRDTGTGETDMTDNALDLDALEARRSRLRDAYLIDRRPVSSARGIHHIALISSDVERTIRFYQEILEFPLTEIVENRDYKGSTHFFFDVGHGNLLAFFDFPGLDLGPYAEVLGGLHHLALSVTPESWRHLRDKLDAAAVPFQVESGSSIYFRDPDGARIELLAEPLGEMYGNTVL